MPSLDVQEDTNAFSTLLGNIEARFSIEIDGCRHDALLSSLEHYAESISESLGNIAKRATAGLLSADEWSMILHLATNHETRFFRSVPAIEQIVKICRTISNPRILSVGCSTGEEPYSIATALISAGRAGFRVHGTDVSALCINAGRDGIYKQNPAIGPIAATSISPTKMRFHAWVRDMVTFEQHNILQDRPVQFLRPHIVITQNMLIYYREESRHEILNRLASMLDVGGYLITATAETHGWDGSGMTRVDTPFLNVYVRSN